MTNQQSAQYTSGTTTTFINQTHENIKFNQIIISDDKLENILLKHLRGLENNKAWLTPLGLFISLILTLTTAKFESKVFGLQPSTWEAIFVISSVISCIWLVITSFQAFSNKKEYTIDKLIKRIKNQE